MRQKQEQLEQQQERLGLLQLAQQQQVLEQQEQRLLLFCRKRTKRQQR